MNYSAQTFEAETFTKATLAILNFIGRHVLVAINIMGTRKMRSRHHQNVRRV